jgi:hypothetical protein
MNRLIIAATLVALTASIGAADAQTSHRTRHQGAQGSLVQRNVALPAQSGYHANSDLKYGPQIDYPQSPAGGGY